MAQMNAFGVSVGAINTAIYLLPLVVIVSSYLMLWSTMISGKRCGTCKIDRISGIS